MFERNGYNKRTTTENYQNAQSFIGKLFLDRLSLCVPRSGGINRFPVVYRQLSNTLYISHATQNRRIKRERGLERYKAFDWIKRLIGSL